MIPPMREPPILRASIIVATHNRCELLRACLRTLPWAEISAAPAEVIVVDDASTDGTATMVEQEYPGAILLRNAENRNLAESHNTGARHARGRLIVNIDSDVEVAAGWFEALLAADDDAHVLGGRVLDFRTRQPQSGPRRSTFLGKSLACTAEQATVGIGCNLAFPRRIFDAIGGFDPDFPNYFDDSDFCIRARRAGFGFRYVAGAVVYHKGSATRQGHAVYLQERHSSFAMLKAYRGRPLRLVLFTLGNGLWLLLRLGMWRLQGRREDVENLAQGWLAAYRRYWYNRPEY